MKLFNVILVLVVPLISTHVLALEEDLYHGQPKSESYPHELTVLDNKGFAVGFDPVRKVPAWAAYRLPSNPGQYDFERPSYFRQDSRISADLSHDDYTNTGYDRGHMAPNYGIMTRYGRKGQRQSFFISNVAPMKPALNRGPWKKLQQRIARRYANSFGEVWVVTGPLFDNREEDLDSGIEIPDAFFKMVIDEKEGHP